MMWTKLDRIRELARLAGITIAEDELEEVADRLDSVVGELEKLAALDLASIEPVTTFADEADHGA